MCLLWWYTRHQRHRCAAYNFGYSVALWDCDDGVEIAQDARGTPQDFPLNDPRLLNRPQIHMGRRLIDVTTVTADNCPTCVRR
jgi:hypothetical protein